MVVRGGAATTADSLRPVATPVVREGQRASRHRPRGGGRRRELRRWVVAAELAEAEAQPAPQQRLEGRGAWPATGDGDEDDEDDEGGEKDGAWPGLVHVAAGAPAPPHMFLWAPLLPPTPPPLPLLFRGDEGMGDTTFVLEKSPPRPP